MYVILTLGGGGGVVRVGASSQFKAETEKTGEDTAGNHRQTSPDDVFLIWRLKNDLKLIFGMFVNSIK